MKLILEKMKRENWNWMKTEIGIRRNLNFNESKLVKNLNLQNVALIHRAKDELKNLPKKMTFEKIGKRKYSDSKNFEPNKIS